MPKHVDPPRFIRLPQVLEMTGLSTSTIYRWMTDGTFPKQIQLGSRSVVWNERDFIDWMNEQISNDKTGIDRGPLNSLNPGGEAEDRKLITPLLFTFSSIPKINDKKH